MEGGDLEDDVPGLRRRGKTIFRTRRPTVVAPPVRGRSPPAEEEKKECGACAEEQETGPCLPLHDGGGGDTDIRE